MYIRLNKVIVIVIVIVIVSHFCQHSNLTQNHPDEDQCSSLSSAVRWTDTDRRAGATMFPVPLT